MVMTHDETTILISSLAIAISIVSLVMTLIDIFSRKD